MPPRDMHWRTPCRSSDVCLTFLVVLFLAQDGLMLCSAANVAPSHVRAVYNVKLVNSGRDMGNGLVSTAYTLCTQTTPTPPVNNNNTSGNETGNNTHGNDSNTNMDRSGLSLQSRIQHVRDALRAHQLSQTTEHDNHTLDGDVVWGQATQQSPSSRSATSATEDALTHEIRLLMCDSGQGVEVNQQIFWMAHMPPGLVPYDLHDHNSAAFATSTKQTDWSSYARVDNSPSMENIVGGCARWSCDMEYALHAAVRFLSLSSDEQMKQMNSTSRSETVTYRNRSNTTNGDNISTVHGSEVSYTNDVNNTSNNNEAGSKDARESKNASDWQRGALWLRGHPALNARSSTGTAPRGIHLHSAYGGWGASAVCCGSLNSSMYLIHTNTSTMMIVQTDTLLYDNLGHTPNASNRAPIQYTDRPGTFLTPPSSTADHAAEPPREENASRAARYWSGCAATLMESSRTRRTDLHIGNGKTFLSSMGIRFLVMPRLCGHAVSDIVSSSTNFLQRGYTLSVVANEFADEVALPDELIVSVLRWIRVLPERSGVGYGATSLFDGGLCQVEHTRGVVSSYRTGRRVVCPISEAMHTALPELEIWLSENRMYNITAKANTNGRVDEDVQEDEDEDDEAMPACHALRIDLNRQVRAIGAERARRLYATDHTSPLPRYELVLASTGSYTAEYAKKNINDMHEPVIAVGLAALSGVDVFAVTRHLVRRSDVETSRTARAESGHSHVNDKQISNRNSNSFNRSIKLPYYKPVQPFRLKRGSGQVQSLLSTRKAKNEVDVARMSPWLGQPVMFFTNASTATTATRDNASKTQPSVVGLAPQTCMPQAVCEGNAVYIESINRCAQIDCRGYLLYVYSTRTLQCELNKSVLVALVCAVGVLLATELLLFRAKRRLGLVMGNYVQSLTNVMEKKQ